MTISESVPAPPEGLEDRGRQLWLDVTGDFEMTAGEQAVLREACSTLDELERLKTALREADDVVVGSMGQPVVNRLFDDVRRHRELLNKLLSSLKVVNGE